MAQKSIRSFFAAPKQKNTENVNSDTPRKSCTKNGKKERNEEVGKENVELATGDSPAGREDEASPVKTPVRTRGGRRIIESDDESEDGDVAMETSKVNGNATSPSPAVGGDADLNDRPSTSSQADSEDGPSTSSQADPQTSPSQTALPYNIPLRATARKPKRKSDEECEKSESKKVKNGSRDAPTKTRGEPAGVTGEVEIDLNEDDHPSKKAENTSLSKKAENTSSEVSVEAERYEEEPMKTEDCENKEGDEEEEEEEAASGNSVQPRSGKQLKFDSPSSSKSKAAITPKNASKSKVGAKSESKSKRGKTKRIGSKSKVDGAKVESVKPRDEATPKSATVDDAVVPSGGDKEKSGDKASKPAKNPFAGFGVKKTEVEEYHPEKTKYDPIKDACWKRGERVPYLALAKAFKEIEAVSARLRMIEILSNLLRSVILLTPDDLVACIRLSLNQLAPAYEGVELGIGESLLMKTIVQATGRSMDKIKADVQEKGDLGLVAEASRGNQRTMFVPAKLTVAGVLTKLKEIANMTGNSVMTKKVDKIKGMFVACRQSEARYLIRSLGGKLRIGLAEQSVLQAIAQAVTLSPPGQDYPPEVSDAGRGVKAETMKKRVEDAALIIKTTYCECPNYEAVIGTLLAHGVSALPQYCKLTPGVPLKPMLAHPTKGVQEVLRRFENAKFTCEYKYDGERAQIHLLEGGGVRVYSRSQEDNTSKYPDIVARMPAAVGPSVTSAVIDSEAVAWDPVARQILPFQVLSTRKRKDADAASIKVQVCVYAFDLLYLNGESLVTRPFCERRALLRGAFTEVEGEFVFAKSITSADTEDIGVFLEESIKGNCEGLMVKTLEVDATYEIAKRSRNWLKLKKDYLDGVGDTLDLLVIGGYHGNGKRVGKYGGFLMACYDADNEEFQTICKIGTGFSDDDLTAHTALLSQHVVAAAKPYYRWHHALQPDVWFDSVQVWEVKAADLSISPVHTAAAGLVDPEKGISLRFPRFLRIRHDKKTEETTSSSQVAEMYRSQQQIVNQKGGESGAKEGEEDFY